MYILKVRFNYCLPFVTKYKQHRSESFSFGNKTLIVVEYWIKSSLFATAKIIISLYKHTFFFVLWLFIVAV